MLVYTNLPQESGMEGTMFLTMRYFYFLNMFWCRQIKRIMNFTDRFCTRDINTIQIVWKLVFWFVNWNIESRSIIGKKHAQNTKQLDHTRFCIANLLDTDEILENFLTFLWTNFLDEKNRNEFLKNGKNEVARRKVLQTKK